MTTDSSASLQLRIRRDIEERIMAGELRPGDRIPFEHELMAEHGCSRMTVNRALSALAEAGLIERRRRAGSFVARPRIHMAALAIPDIRAEIEGRGGAYGLDLLRREEVAPGSDARPEARMPDGVRCLSLLCRHRSDWTPFAIEDRLINIAAVPEAAGVDFGREPPGSWLLAHVPWHEAEHRISAAAATDQEAQLLGIAPAAACLILERWTWRAGEAVTYVRQTFPGTGFDLTARFAAER